MRRQEGPLGCGMYPQRAALAYMEEVPVLVPATVVAVVAAVVAAVAGEANMEGRQKEMMEGRGRVKGWVMRERSLSVELAYRASVQPEEDRERNREIEHERERRESKIKDKG